MTRSAHQIRISEAMKLHWKGRRQSKYGAVPTTVDGVRFASKAEAKRDAELLILARAGALTELQRQPKFDFIIQGVKVCRYVGDWSYVEESTLKNGMTFRKRVVEDRKGVRTPAFNIKWKLAQALYPEIEWRLS